MLSARKLVAAVFRNRKGVLMVEFTLLTALILLIVTITVYLLKNWL
jgi:Flp pilus assembly protein TadG